MSLQSILEIIKKAQERHPAFKQCIAEADALNRWDLAVGELIAKHAQAVRVKRGVLWVEVDHPIWKAELHYRKQQILDILNGKSPCGLPGTTQLTTPMEILTDIYYVSKRPQARR